MTRAIMLTGTIDPGAFNNTNVKLTDVQMRLMQYESAIEFYLRETKLKKVIFVENSGYRFDVDKFNTIAKKYGKEFEFIPIKTDYNKTVELGKSYGEGDCIEQGVIKSRLLELEESFYKVTGRVIIRNIDRLLDQDDYSRCVFRNDLNRCYTVFFKMNKKMFLENFIGCKNLCNENMDIDIEMVFHRIIKNKKLLVRGFKEYPKYDGIIGTLGIAYNDPKFVWVVKTICMKLGMFSRNGNGALLDIIAKIRVSQAKKSGER